MKLLVKMICTMGTLIVLLSGCHKANEEYVIENIILSMDIYDDSNNDEFMKNRSKEIMNNNPEIAYQIHYLCCDLNNDGVMEYLLYISSVIHSSSNVFFIEIWMKDSENYIQIGDIYFDGHSSSTYKSINTVTSNKTNGFYDIVTDYCIDDIVYKHIYKYDGIKYSDRNEISLL